MLHSLRVQLLSPGSCARFPIWLDAAIPAYGVSQSSSRRPGMCRSSGVPSVLAASCGRNRCPCRGGSSSLVQLRAGGSPFDLPGLVDFFHDRIPLRIVGQGTLGPKKSVARPTNAFQGDRSHGNLNFLALDGVEVFVQFNAPAPHDAVECLGYSRCLLEVAGTLLLRTSLSPRSRLLKSFADRLAMHVLALFAEERLELVELVEGIPLRYQTGATRESGPR